MKIEKKYKPIWLVYNRTYRKYAKGLTRKQIARYGGKLIEKLRRMLRKGA